ncbi:MAG: alpha/beta hydrolase [Bdellovibrionales bacterium]|nr:alpha/beta hydrolase [Bdellovibrionales bacterium]
MILEKFYGELAGPETGEKLVFLHGLMGSAANWRGVVPAFSDKYQVLTYDQRGHGRSIQPENGYDPEDFAEDLRLILGELGWQKIYLVGHSMGGRNALHFAYKYPEIVNKLVIEDIGPDTSEVATRRIEDLLDSVPTPFASRSEARSFFQNQFEGLHPKNPRARAIGQYLYTNIKETDTGLADWRFFKKGILRAATRGRAVDRWAEVKGLVMPTLWIRGDESVEFPHEVYEQVLQSNKKIRGILVSPSGHWVHFDQTQQFIDEVRHFLEENTE